MQNQVTVWSLCETGHLRVEKENGKRGKIMFAWHFLPFTERRNWEVRVVKSWQEFPLFLFGIHLGISYAGFRRALQPIGIETFSKTSKTRLQKHRPWFAGEIEVPAVSPTVFQFVASPAWFRKEWLTRLTNATSSSSWVGARSFQIY